MAHAHEDNPTGPFRTLSVTVAAIVALMVATSWYVTYASMDDAMMGLFDPMMGGYDPTGVAAFTGLMVIMMVAMMLPSALPMILAFHGLTKMEAGKPTKPADGTATVLFVIPYFLVWGAAAALAVIGLVALGLTGGMGSMEMGELVPAGVLVAAGIYQFTGPKQVCLTHCQSPMGFVMRHWRSGRLGAVRMGLSHSKYCLGCCWLLMAVLFVVGAMSLLWMGLVSLAIFVEKVAPSKWPVSRVLGAVILVPGVLLLLRGLLG